jgi:hypothetical protein
MLASPRLALFPLFMIYHTADSGTGNSITLSSDHITSPFISWQGLFHGLLCFGVTVSFATLYYKQTVTKIFSGILIVHGQIRGFVHDAGTINAHKSHYLNKRPQCGAEPQNTALKETFSHRASCVSLYEDPLEFTPLSTRSWPFLR